MLQMQTQMQMEFNSDFRNSSDAFRVKSSEDDDKIKNAFRVKSSEDDDKSLLTAKIAELEKTKEDLKQAKDDAMQSWLDSRPLIDELEKTQAELESAKNRILKANTTISEIQAHLGTTDMCIKSTKEEEQKFRTLINETNQALHKSHEDMEQLKTKIDQKRRLRSKLRLVLRLKKQTLQALQLTYEAICFESEAFATSAAQARRYINNKESAYIMVQLTHEEYEYLKREASEQTSLAESRILVSVEEKLAAENSRDAAFRRLKNLYPHKISSRRMMGHQTVHNEHNMKETGQANTKVEGKTNHSYFYKAPPTGANERNQQQQFKKHNNSHSVMKRKSSIFFRIKTFFVRKLSKYFK